MAGSEDDDSEFQSTAVVQEDDENSVGLDLYTDLFAADTETEKQKISEVQLAQLAQHKQELDQLRKANASLEQQNKALLQNISSLYKTAKRELDSKDSIIQELKERWDNYCFRRRTHSPFSSSSTCHPKNNRDFHSDIELNRKLGHISEVSGKEFSVFHEKYKTVESQSNHRSPSLNHLSDMSAKQTKRRAEDKLYNEDHKKKRRKEDDTSGKNKSRKLNLEVLEKENYLTRSESSPEKISSKSKPALISSSQRVIKKYDCYRNKSKHKTSCSQNEVSSSDDDDDDNNDDEQDSKLKKYRKHDGKRKKGEYSHHRADCEESEVDEDVTKQKRNMSESKTNKKDKHALSKAERKGYKENSASDDSKESSNGKQAELADLLRLMNYWKNVKRKEKKSKHRDVNQSSKKYENESKVNAIEMPSKAAKIKSKPNDKHSKEKVEKYSDKHSEERHSNKYTKENLEKPSKHKENLEKECEKYRGSLGKHVEKCNRENSGRYHDKHGKNVSNKYSEKYRDSSEKDYDKHSRDNLGQHHSKHRDSVEKDYEKYREGSGKYDKYNKENSEKHHEKCRDSMEKHREKCKDSVEKHHEKCRVNVEKHHEKCRDPAEKHHEKCKDSVEKHHEKCKDSVEKHHEKCKDSVEKHHEKCKDSVEKHHEKFKDSVEKHHEKCRDNAEKPDKHKETAEKKHCDKQQESSAKLHDKHSNKTVKKNSDSSSESNEGCVNLRNCKIRIQLPKKEVIKNSNTVSEDTDQELLQYALSAIETPSPEIERPEDITVIEKDSNVQKPRSDTTEQPKDDALKDTTEQPKDDALKENSLPNNVNSAEQEQSKIQDDATSKVETDKVTVPPTDADKEKLPVIDPQCKAKDSEPISSEINNSCNSQKQIETEKNPPEPLRENIISIQEIKLPDAPLDEPTVEKPLEGPKLPPKAEEDIEDGEIRSDSETESKLIKAAERKANLVAAPTTPKKIHDRKYYLRQLEENKKKMLLRRMKVLAAKAKEINLAKQQPSPKKSPSTQIKERHHSSGVHHSSRKDESHHHSHHKSDVTKTKSKSSKTEKLLQCKSCGHRSTEHDCLPIKKKSSHHSYRRN